MHLRLLYLSHSTIKGMLPKNGITVHAFSILDAKFIREEYLNESCKVIY